MRTINCHRIIVRDNEIVSKDIIEITESDFIDGSLMNARQFRNAALDMVNHWNYLASITDLGDGIYHYYLQNQSRSY